LFKKAVQYQTDLMIETILGNGMDCHINTLKTVAIQIGMENIPFIQDESLKTNELFQLSTSQIPTSVEGSFMCYGPVVPDGYGCSYNPKRDYILFTIASNRTCPHTCTIRFKEALEAALNEIYELFNQA
jgi:choline O-acetyltransferase